jgi:hypothetical protein
MTFAKHSRLLLGTLFWVDGSYFSFPPLIDHCVRGQKRRKSKQAQKPPRVDVIAWNKTDAALPIYITKEMRAIQRTRRVYWLGSYHRVRAYRARFSSSLMVSSLPWPSSNWTWQSNGRETVIHSRHTYPQHALEKENESVSISFISISISLLLYVYTRIHVYTAAWKLEERKIYRM